MHNNLNAGPVDAHLLRPLLKLQQRRQGKGKSPRSGSAGNNKATAATAGGSGGGAADHEAHVLCVGAHALGSNLPQQYRSATNNEKVGASEKVAGVKSGRVQTLALSFWVREPP